MIPEEYKEPVQHLRLMGKLAGRVWRIEYATMTYSGARCWYAERRWRVTKFHSIEAAHRGYPKSHSSFTTFDNMKKGLLKTIGIVS